MTNYTISINVTDEAIGSELRKQISDLIEKFCTINKDTVITMSSSSNSGQTFGKQLDTRNILNG